MALELISVPIEPICIVVKRNVEDVRRTIATNTSAFSTISQGLRGGVAVDPSLPFLGEVTNAQIRITRNSSMRNSGRPFLRAKLIGDDGQTIVKGWLGVHFTVVIFIVALVLFAQDRALHSLFALPFLAILLGAGYLYERGKLLRALRRCLNDSGETTESLSK